MKSEVRRIQHDAIVGFDAGISIHASVWSNRAMIDILPPGFAFTSTAGPRLDIDGLK